MAKGQKSCPKCKTTGGPRTKTCKSCGHEFEFKKSIESLVNTKCDIPGEPTTAELIFVPGDPLWYRRKPEEQRKKIYTPVAIKGTTDENILEYIEKMKAYTVPGHRLRPRKYSRSAIRTFLINIFWDGLKDGETANKAIKLLEQSMQPYKQEIIEGYECDLNRWHRWKRGLETSPV